MAYLEINELKKKYNDFNLDLSLDIEEGELLCIIGPSGSGKSTLLSIISGIETPTSGSIILDGKNITNEAIQKREIGMVFQDYALFSSMNVEKNIQYGMKEKDRSKRKNLTKNLLMLVGLPGYEKRNVSKLSGGEAQRVALARSIATEPRILLLDEPLSALDAPMRKKLRSMIRSIHDTLGITMVYVTHDREEAFAISDRIMIMKDGKNEALGYAEELYRKPPNLFTAFFTGDGTSMPASYFDQSRSGTLFFRPENVMISEESVDPGLYPNHFVLNGVTVLSAEYAGSRYMLGLDYLGYPMLASSALKPRKKDVSLIILKENLIFF